MKNNCKNTCEKCLSYVQPGDPCVVCEKSNCYEVYSIDCVIYDGTALECFDIKPKESLGKVFDKLIKSLEYTCN
jgi:hypothetical protein